jgi:hypothetical protein
MSIINLLSVIYFLITVPVISNDAGTVHSFYTVQDTIKDDQTLYTGRLWIKKYSNIDGDEFLFTGDYLNGSVSIGGRIYQDIPLKYDIYNDEIISPNNRNLVIQLNKERIDSFSLVFLDKVQKFRKISADTVKGFNGFVNVLYSGSRSFCVKYKKNIELLAVDRKFDKFYETRKMFLLQDGKVNQFAGRAELFKLMGEKKQEVRNYIKKNKLQIFKNQPESFIPVIAFYDNLLKQNL